MSRLNYASTLAALLTMAASPAMAQHHDMSTMDMPQTSTDPHAGHDMSDMDMSENNGWQVMTHAVLTFAADDQEGPRGDSKTFTEGMVMVMASRALDDRTDLDLNLMLSPDAFMGKSGYPLLLQTGETADGIHHLIDAQHPHDLFMGMTAKLTRRFNNDTMAFVLVGWPGEFGFGPTAFMHRASGENFPTAPITHHWLDSGHITMGVVTAGLARGPLQLEVTQFTGREPDQNRFDLETPHLDSTAVRLTWAVSDALTVQASAAHQVSPEQLHPDEDINRQSLSIDYSHAFPAGQLSTTMAWGRKQAVDGLDKPSDAWLFENTFKINDRWMALGRYERVYNDELVDFDTFGGAYWVAKTEVGAIRTFAIRDDMTLGLGLVRQFNSVPDALKPVYGDHPNGTVAFLTLKIHPMDGMKM